MLRGLVILFFSTLINSGTIACAADVKEAPIIFRSYCGPTITEFKLHYERGNLRSIAVGRALSYYNKETSIVRKNGGEFIIKYREKYRDGDEFSLALSFDQTDAHMALNRRLISQNSRVTPDILNLFGEALEFYILFEGVDPLDRKGLENVINNCELNFWAY